MEETKNTQPLPPRPMPPKRPIPQQPVESKPTLAQADSVAENNLDSISLNENSELPQNEQAEVNIEGQNVKPTTKVKKSGKSNKEQKKRDKKPKNKKKLTIIIIICVLAVACLAGGITYLVITNIQNNKKLLTPELEVVQLYNGTVLNATPILGATSYEFEITKGQESPINIKTSKNAVELSTYLNQAGEYTVRVRAYGKGAGATSDYSEKETLVNRIMLNTPKIFINNLDKTENGYKNNDNLNDDTITWDAVAGAEKYLVRYGADLENGIVKSEEIKSSDDVVSFSLTNLYKNGAGVYQISVVAVPYADSYYNKSSYDKLVILEYYNKQTGVNNLTYNKETNVLEFELPVIANYGNEFDLYITTSQQEPKKYKLYLNECDVKNMGSSILISANLSHITNANISEISVITLGDGIYSENSEAVKITVK